MAKPGRVAGLDIAEDIAFHRRFRKVERAGWGVMIVLVGAALAGLLGNGPASRASLQQGAASVRYERVVHHGSPAALSFAVSGAAPSGPHVAIALDSDYVSAMALEHIVPEPLRVESSAAGVTTFVFATGDGTLRARFAFRPDHVGVRASAVAVGGHALGRLVQVVLP